MKHIKRFNESFEDMPYVIKTVEEMLYQIQDFEFSTEVEFNTDNPFDQNLLFIRIKKNSEDIKVFNSLDIKDFLTEVDEFLTLGEGFKLKEIFATKVPISSEIITFKELIRGVNLLYCELVYLVN